LKTRKIALYILLIILAFLVMLPLLTVFSFSLKSLTELQTERWALPTQLHLSNYVEAFKIISPKLLNSFIITLPAVFGAVFVASLAAFGLTQFKFKMKHLYFYLILSTALIPTHTIIGPVFTIWHTLNLDNSYLGIILIEMIVSLPFATIMLRSFFAKIPKELIEAAQIDGCSFFNIFLRIVLPISRPALISVAMLEFTYIWNDFLWPLILAPNSEYHTVTMGILSLTGQFTTQWHLMAAAALFASLPPLVLFTVFQKYFVKGIMGGAVIKG
jgi:multiple sugar transport system permease protein